jgi:hypothetical protein
LKGNVLYWKSAYTYTYIEHKTHFCPPYWCLSVCWLVNSSVWFAGLTSYVTPSVACF